jgi:hypothetical protein
MAPGHDYNTALDIAIEATEVGGAPHRHSAVIKTTLRLIQALIKYTKGDDGMGHDDALKRATATSGRQP